MNYLITTYICSLLSHRRLWAHIKMDLGGKCRKPPHRALDFGFSGWATLGLSAAVKKLPADHAR